MRKDNSEFITEFITKPGHFTKNRDYFAYVELDDYACWVLADGIDSAHDILSAEIVVGSILNEFAEKPSMKRKHIKRYIKNANKALLHESRIIKLQTTVLVVVTDYSSIVWGNVGNTRLYHFRNERLKARSKDHSVAQMMVDAGQVEERKANQHREKNNLTKFLGQGRKIKPYVSKKTKLKDEDALLICTSGFWENVNDQEIEGVLKEATDAKDFVAKLEKNILKKGNRNLNNYSMISLFIKKAFKETSNRGKFLKKVAIFLIPIVMLAGGYLIYQKVNKIKTLKAMKIKKENLKLGELKDTYRLEAEGDELFEIASYNEALNKYKEAKEVYDKFKQKEKLNIINQKIKETGNIIEGRENEIRADDYFNNENYQEAITKYNEARLSYLKVEDYNLNTIEEKIVKANNMLKAIDYEQEGDIFYKAGKFAIAKEKYNNALEICKQNRFNQKLTMIKIKIEDTNQLIIKTEKIAKAEIAEDKGDEFFQSQEFENANLKYLEAKIIYLELNKTEEAQKIEKKIKNVILTKNKIEAEEYEEVADMYMQAEKKEYDEALFNYKEANKIYSKINMSNKVKKIDYKINNLLLAKTLNQAKNYKELAQIKLTKENYQEALLNYKKALELYVQSNMTKEIAEIEEMLESVNYSKAKKYEDSADKYFKEREYDKALDNYEQAKEIYSNINKSEELEVVENKIARTKEKKDKFLFIF
ncbi:hypothetical protein U472_13120 [Orenia metallireducens]|uniref:PPM-type phosphatase domain-containing protein n=1 Tax=Orenia metallireducens TaxID=1413210 RepID=A0A1C0A599_9FIRM|nr:protein phosphatase 2C domain-containing protein [Orenia metallireducens]OCL25293.1 hypothetical protein U472_13120 [Orenia metallireducens]